MNPLPAESIEQAMQADVLSASAGDTEAFSRLIERSQRTVTSIALAIVKDIDASEEVAQEVFIHIWQKLRELRNPLSFLPWVRQVTRYRALNFLRDNKVRERIGGDEAEALLENFASGDEPAQRLLKDEQYQLLQLFIERLPEESREIVLLYYREEQNAAQVAALLGLSEANVRKKLQRARDRVKQQWLKKYGSLVFSTAPGAAFTCAAATSLASFSPPAAAAASAAAVKASGLSKVLMFLGGAMLGALAGLVGILLGMHGPIKLAKTESEKQQLLRLRNFAVLAMLAFGLLFSAAYELSAGATAPILTYLALVAGIVWFNHRVYGIVFEERGCRVELFAWLGTALGLASGFTALIVGLLQAGRLSVG